MSKIEFYIDLFLESDSASLLGGLIVGAAIISILFLSWDGGF